MIFNKTYYDILLLSFISCAYAYNYINANVFKLYYYKVINKILVIKNIYDYIF